MVALMAAVAIMMIMLAAAVPSWRYVMRNDAEEELIFRGGEIADAIARYQKRNGNALPPSLEVLVKGKFLRRPYKDPMTKHGRWRFIRPGEVVGPGASGIPGTTGGTTTTTTTTTTRPSAFSQPGVTLGGFQGVASTSTEKSLRVFNGRTRYNEWVFLPGQPRVVGRPVGRRCRGPAGLPTAEAALGRLDDPAVAAPPPTAAVGWLAWGSRRWRDSGRRRGDHGRRRREGLRLRHERRRGKARRGSPGIAAPGGGTAGPGRAGLARADRAAQSAPRPDRWSPHPGAVRRRPPRPPRAPRPLPRKRGRRSPGSLRAAGRKAGARWAGRARPAARGRRGRRGRRRAGDHEGLDARAARVGHQGEVDSQALENGEDRLGGGAAVEAERDELPGAEPS